ncbi:MAG TPA: hypothetical protein VFV27_03270 [Nevskiaceae bacterium]|nr:hypothetical protein [Nevskiaceae bacterium]
MSLRPILKAGLAAALLLTSSLASAEDVIDDTPSGGAMAFDLLVARPLGVVGTVLGLGLFFVQLPLSIVQGEPPGDPARKLVVEPARWTFTRPLGELE